MPHAREHACSAVRSFAGVTIPLCNFLVYVFFRGQDLAPCVKLLNGKLSQLIELIESM